ncbi:unnamed protein product [Amoebophrya sp. A25]|nr:unnamed protein product [Amoebophrya sp. A25]|eukprot:GSA25T00012009001.1
MAGGSRGENVDIEVDAPPSLEQVNIVFPSSDDDEGLSLSFFLMLVLVSAFIYCAWHAIENGVQVTTCLAEAYKNRDALPSAFEKGKERKEDGEPTRVVGKKVDEESCGKVNREQQFTCEGKVKKG